MKKYTNTSKLILSFSLIVFANLTCANLYPEKFGLLVGAYRGPTYQNPEKIAADQATADTETNPYIHPLAEETIPLPLVDLHVKNNYLLQHFFTFNPGNTGALNFLPQTTWNSANLLQGQNNVFDTIDRTITPFGAAELTKWLITTKTINALTRQQNVINFLHKRKEAADELTNHLHGIKKYEHAYFNFLQLDPNIERVINQLFYYNQGSWGETFGLGGLNTSTLGQNIFYGTERLKSLAKVGIGAGIGAATLYGVNEYKKQLTDNPIPTLTASALGYLGLQGYKTLSNLTTGTNEKISKLDILEHKINTGNLGANEQALVEAIQNGNTELAKELDQQKINIFKKQRLVTLDGNKMPDYETLTNDIYSGKLQEKIRNLSTFDKAIAASGATAALLGTGHNDSIIENIGNTLDSTYKNITYFPENAWETEKANANLLPYMHGQLINMGHIARHIQALNTTLKQRPVFAKNLMYGKYIQGLFDKNSTDVPDTMRYLMGQLLTNTFTGQPSWVSNKGRIIATYKLMRESVKEWIPVLEAIGEIDAYVSCAKLYDEYKNTAHKFTFVTYPKDLLLHNGYAHPQVHIEQLWNLINPDTQVTTKTMTIGTTPDNVAVVKNVNELQATVLAIILGSTIGIAPAHHMKLTPFAKIETLMGAITKENVALQQASHIVGSAQDNDAHASLQVACIDGTNRAMASLTNKVIEEIKPLQNVAVILAQ